MKPSRFTNYIDEEQIKVVEKIEVCVYHEYRGASYYDFIKIITKKLFNSYKTFYERILSYSK